MVYLNALFWFIPFANDIHLNDWNSHCNLYQDGTLFEMGVTDFGEPELQENVDALRE